jgi:hypothetical protein
MMVGRGARLIGVTEIDFGGSVKTARKKSTQSI